MASYKILFWLLGLILAAAFIFIGYNLLAGQADEYLFSFTDRLGEYGSMATGLLIIAAGIGLLLPGFSNGSGSMLSLILIVFIIAAIIFEEYPLIIPASVALVLLQFLLNIRPKAFPKAVDKIEAAIDNVEERIEDFLDGDDADKKESLSQESVEDIEDAEFIELKQNGDNAEG